MSGSSSGRFSFMRRCDVYVFSGYGPAAALTECSQLSQLHLRFCWPLLVLILAYKAALFMNGSPTCWRESTCFNALCLRRKWMPGCPDMSNTGQTSGSMAGSIYTWGISTIFCLGSVPSVFVFGLTMRALSGSRPKRVPKKFY